MQFTSKFAAACLVAFTQAHHVEFGADGTTMDIKFDVARQQVEIKTHVRNGTFLTVGFGDIPLDIDMMLFQAHDEDSHATLIRQNSGDGDWDGQQLKLPYDDLYWSTCDCGMYIDFTVYRDLVTDRATDTTLFLNSSFSVVYAFNESSLAMIQNDTEFGKFDMVLYSDGNKSGSYSHNAPEESALIKFLQ